MSSIFDCGFTKTLDAVFEAAGGTNTLYVDKKDGSLVCSHWLPASFNSRLSVADISTVISKIDEAFTLTERMLELHPDQANSKEINPWILAALRTQQLFCAASKTPTANAMINNIATHRTFHFHMPENINECVVGIAEAVKGPYQLTPARGPNVIGGRYFYGEDFNYVKGLLQMAVMGLYTQLERLASCIIKVVQAVTSVFGLPLTNLNRFHYFRNNETNNDIYDTESIPLSFDKADASKFSSYWLGHASCLFSVPVQDTKGVNSRVNIITDPIEGDLNSLLYPRMTDVARPIEQCPPIHVCLLSHNHLDHFSPATLQKLLRFSPLMVVPKGDAERLKDLGFSRIVEVGWFERIDVQIKDTDGREFQIGISGVPANHGSGNNSQPSRTSLFNGYVLQSAALPGDVYFAGDTARLDEEHTKALRDTFDIRFNFQPGGPDDVRSLNVDSHQASCDGIAMHLHLMIKKAYERFVTQTGTTPSFEQLCDISSALFTVYMHTKTYKLGNLHFDDTDASVGRILHWLETSDSWNNIEGAEGLMQHERELLLELARATGSMPLQGEESLSPKNLFRLFQTAGNNISIPKIGARFSAPE